MLKIKRYKPLIDKLFYIISIPTAVLLAGATVLAALEPFALLIIIPVDISCIYFIISPLFGYVELRQGTVFIKLGFFMKREIPYSKIRGITKARRVYADSMVSLKNSLTHVNIKYNTFDILSVSVKDNDGFIEELNARRKAK